MPDQSAQADSVGHSFGVTAWEPHIVPRLPFDPAGGIEHLLAQANSRRLADADHRLASRGLDPDVLLAASGVFPVEPYDAWSAAEIWTTIDEHLVYDDCRPPRLEFLADDSRDIDRDVPCRNAYELVRPDLGGLLSRLDSAVALTVRQLDGYSSVYGTIADDIETLTGQSCHLDGIVFGSGASFKDEPDSPILRVLIVADGQITVEVVDAPNWAVTAGQMCVVPADLNCRITASTRSLALRVPFRFPSLQQLRGLSAGRAHFHPALRADLPADLDRPVHSYAGSLFDGPEAFMDEVEQALSAVAMDDAVARLRMVLRPRPRHDPLQVLGSRRKENVMLRSCVQGGFLMGDGPDGAMLLGAGHQMAIADELIADFVPLLDGRVFSRDEVLARADQPEHLANAIDALLWIDLFEVVSP